MQVETLFILYPESRTELPSKAQKRASWRSSWTCAAKLRGLATPHTSRAPGEKHGATQRKAANRRGQGELLTACDRKADRRKRVLRYVQRFARRKGGVSLCAYDVRVGACVHGEGRFNETSLARSQSVLHAGTFSCALLV